MSFRLAARAPLALGATLALVLTVAPAFAAPSTPEPVQHLKISLTASDGSLTKVATSGKTSDDTAATELRKQEPDASLKSAPDSEPAAVGDATTAAVLTDVIETPNFVVAGLDWPAGQQFPSDAEVFLRVSERGHWSDWTPVQVEPQHEGGRFGTEPFVSGNAEKVQVQVTGAADELPADLRLSIVTPGGPPTSLTTARANAAVAITATKEGNTGRALGIRPRSDWAGTAYQPPSAPTYTTIKAAVVHHTAGTNTYTQTEVPGILRGIAAYHMTSQGWNDVGYNFLVDKYGGMWEGRSGSLDAAATQMVQGAHALGYNSNTMGVSVLGTYSTVAPTDASFTALKTVMSFRFDLARLDARDRSGILDKNGADMARIVGHRDVNSTDCPGQLLWNRLPALREQVGAPGSSTPAPNPAVVFADVSPQTSGFAADIDWLAAQGITKGWEVNGLFYYRPAEAINRDAMAAFLYRLAGSPAFTPPGTSPFTDLTTTDQFYKEVTWLYAKGITTGWVTDGQRTYGPLQPINRDAMAAFLYRLAGSPQFTAPATSPFTDIAPTDQFYKEVNWALSKRVTTGWADGGYHPAEAISREAMAAFLHRFMLYVD